MKSFSSFSLVVIGVFLLLFSTQTKAQNNNGGVRVTQAPITVIKLVYAKHNLCNGDRKGAINIDVSGGIPPYTYKWSNGATTQDLTGLPAGNYKVIVADRNKCKDSLEVEIKQQPKLEIVEDSVSHILCYGYKKGSISITVNGGTPPYKYTWSNGATTQDISNVNAGVYSILVSDANSCQEIMSSEINENPLIVRSVDDIKNIKCKGDSTGRINISVNGGVPPYTYLWNTGETKEDLSNLKAGKYTVIVTDASGCKEATNTTVSEPDLLKTTVENVKHIDCHGTNSGAVNISVTGGVEPYKFQWTNGAVSQNINGVKAGENNVKIIDANGCSVSTGATINQPELLIASVTEQKNVTYNAGSNGSIKVSVSGGVPPYKYNWSNGAKTKDISGLKAGSYSLLVVDANGCSKNIYALITEPQALVLNIDAIKDIKCNGDKVGAIQLTVTGGMPPYKYKWNNGSTSEDLNNIEAGKYSVEVTDANGIKKSTSAEVKQPAFFDTKIVKVTNIDCYGDRDGSITISVNGGVLPYKYKWSNGSNTQNIADVPYGNYSVDITDANGCRKNLTTTIEQSPQIIAKISEVKNVLCEGDKTGSIALSVSGGVAPYYYSWSTGVTTPSIANVPKGEYSVTVKDNKGCSKELKTSITEPRKLVASENKIKDVTCYGLKNGSISINVSGGVIPYKYVWSDGSSSKDLQNVSSGSYAVKITDANGCVTSVSSKVTQPNKMIPKLDGVTKVNCYGESKGGINISISGGVAPYAYKWSNGAATQDLTDVKAGSYSVLISDANNCRDTIKATINQNTDLIAKVTKETNINCNGDKKGAVAISVVGGVAPYTYKWSNGLTTQNIANVGAGMYSVVVSDAVGCSKIVSSKVIEPTEFIANLDNKTDVNCYGEKSGAVSITVKGGVTPYNYKWSNGSTSQNINSVVAGTYAVTITDANGCKQYVSTKLTQPSSLVSNIISKTNLKCYGDKSGVINITVKGGSSPYSFKWNNGATTEDLTDIAAGEYSVVITDAHGCNKSLNTSISQPEDLVASIVSKTDIDCHGDYKGAANIAVTGGVAPYTYSWSNGKTTKDIISVPAGNYTVIIKDTKGCIKTINTTISQPSKLEADLISVKNILCYGDSTGAISTTAKGGTAPYTYSWNNGKTTKDITNLKAGNYSIIVKDSKGCTEKLTATVTSPNKLVPYFESVRDVLCKGEKSGIVNISINGGVAPYKYEWNNGATSQDLTNIPAGKYTVNIKDANGCVGKSISATIKEPEILTAKINDVKDVLHYGENNGAIAISVNGGVPSYKYSWSNGAITQNLSLIPSGNYSCLITDANGCVTTVNQLVKQPTSLVASVKLIQDIKCYGEKDGSINIDVTGGQPPYNYTWSNGATTEDISSIPAGVYSVTIKDAIGNKKTLNATVSQPKNFNLKIEKIKHLTCYRSNDGSIITSISGGTPPYRFEWSNGAKTNDILNLPGGDYTVVAKDAHGCQNTEKATVKEPKDLIVKSNAVKHLKCANDKNGAISIDVQGGVAPYSYSWSNGTKTKDLILLSAGNYSVRVVDANGCVASLAENVNEPDPLNIIITSIRNNNCAKEVNGAIAVNVTGGVKPYRYNWSNGNTTNKIDSLKSGKYTITVKDTNNCTAVNDAKVEEPTPLVVKSDDITNVKCNGNTTGEINITVSGGIQPYKYQWSNGATTQDISNVKAGNYSVVVTDGHGCNNSTISVTLSEPTKLNAEIDSVLQIACNGSRTGAVYINVNGGTKPYFYNWNNGSISEDITRVNAGEYTVVIKDANNCAETITTRISQPTPINLSIAGVNNIKCAGDNNGTIDIFVSGGSGNYTYSWSNGATTQNIDKLSGGEYSVVVTDSLGCKENIKANVEEPRMLVKSIDAVTNLKCNNDNSGEIHLTVVDGTEPYTYKWSNGATSQDLIGIPAGNYSVEITEGNGCKHLIEAEVTQPDVFTTNILNIEHIKCNGEKNGSIDLDIKGGVTPYKILWSNGSNKEDLSGLKAESYSVLVQDAHGCTQTASTVIKQPDLLQLAIDSTYSVKCCGDSSGAIFISVTGGVGPYAYKWNNGATTEDITGLKMGQYTVEVTDQNGCTVSTPKEGMTLYDQIISQGKFVTRNINFDVNKATIKPESFPEILKIATLMKDHPDLMFSIEGHTDADGDATSNKILSQDRARAIKNALISLGVDDYRLESKGWGESRPIDSNLTKAGKANNRRVEFILILAPSSGRK